MSACVLRCDCACDIRALPQSFCSSCVLDSDPKRGHGLPNPTVRGSPDCAKIVTMDTVMYSSPRAPNPTRDFSISASNEDHLALTQSKAA
ncbi:hypothetical protein U1Q18_049641 [Sarracenia purpurea var. burkii]